MEYYREKSVTTGNYERVMKVSMLWWWLHSYDLTDKMFYRVIGSGYISKGNSNNSHVEIPDLRIV